ncbi:MAG: endonuclease/exonuclease/phosphatase family protein [Crocinitomicaceae bacterium]|nr:endonuclease/exonuclease/phosphatase family protein [Crocinitomicaceae bacterium]
MKVSESKSGLHWSLRILLWINILNSVLLLGAYINTHISPNSFPYLAFLGLAYPIFLLIAIVFIGLWIFAKPRYVLLSLLTIVIGWNHLTNFYALNWSQAELNQPLKVISFNVRVFDLYNKEGRVENRNKIFDFLSEQNADILCFQEFYNQEEPTLFPTKDTMINLLGTHYYHERYTHEMRGKRYFGVATFSKYPIVNKGQIPFENDPNNYCIFSDVVIRQDTFRVFNGHLGSIRLQNDDYEFFGELDGPEYPEQKEAGQRIMKRLKIAFEKRAVQAEQVAAEIERSPHPVIVCMDLNDTPVSYSYRQFSRILEDAFVQSGNGIGQTYIGKVPSNRIDYIFYDEQLRSANFTTHQVSFSDHKPISCELELKSE